MGKTLLLYAAVSIHQEKATVTQNDLKQESHLKQERQSSLCIEGTNCASHPEKIIINKNRRKNKIFLKQNWEKISVSLNDLSSFSYLHVDFYKFLLLCLHTVFDWKTKISYITSVLRTNSSAVLSAYEADHFIIEAFQGGQA